MISLKYIQLKTIISEVKAFVPTMRADIPQWLKWGHDALGRLEVPDRLDYSIVLAPIKNNRVSVPDTTHSLIQVAVMPDFKEKIRRKEVIEWSKKMFGTGKELIISVECDKCGLSGDCSCDETELVIEADTLDKLANPEFYYGHLKHYKRHGGLGNDNHTWARSNIDPRLIIAKASNSNFHNPDGHIPGCLNLNTRLVGNSPIEYRYDFPNLDFNIKDGWAVVSLFKVRTDEDGYRLMPDITEVTDYIKWYIVYMACMSATMTEHDPTRYERMLQRAERNYRESLAQAYEILTTIDFNEFWTILERDYFSPVKDRTNYLNVNTLNEQTLQQNRLHRK